jgi:hypothetical protein
MDHDLPSLDSKVSNLFLPIMICRLKPQLLTQAFYCAKDDIVWLGYGRKKGLTLLIRIETCLSILYQIQGFRIRSFNFTRGTYGSIIIGTNSVSYVFNQATRSLVPFNSLYHSKVPDNAVVLDQSPGGNKIWFLQQEEISMKPIFHQCN